MAKPVFLAAPDRGHGAHAMVEALLRELQVVTGGAIKGSDVFVPHLHAGEPGVERDAAAWFARTLEALDGARVVVAVLDGPQVDEGVAFLVGCAFAARKPVVGYATDGRTKGALVEGAVLDVARDPHALAAAIGPHLRAKAG